MFIYPMLSLVTTLKSVKIEEKSMAVGVQTIVARLVGGIPGPILYGYFIDNTCILWQQNDCGEYLGYHRVSRRSQFNYFSLQIIPQLGPAWCTTTPSSLW